MGLTIFKCQPRQPLSTVKQSFYSQGMFGFPVNKRPACIQAQGKPIDSNVLQKLIKVRVRTQDYFLGGEGGALGLTLG
jgi:hypothetical protein